MSRHFISILKVYYRCFLFRINRLSFDISLLERFAEFRDNTRKSFSSNSVSRPFVIRILNSLQDKTLGCRPTQEIVKFYKVLIYLMLRLTTKIDIEHIQRTILCGLVSFTT